MDSKDGVYDGKRWFIGINSFLTGALIVSNKNWNIPIEWEVKYWTNQVQINEEGACCIMIGTRSFKMLPKSFHENDSDLFKRITW